MLKGRPSLLSAKEERNTNFASRALLEVEAKNE